MFQTGSKCSVALPIKHVSVSINSNMYLFLSYLVYFYFDLFIPESNWFQYDFSWPYWKQHFYSLLHYISLIRFNKIFINLKTPTVLRIHVVNLFRLSFHFITFQLILWQCRKFATALVDGVRVIPSNEFRHVWSRNICEFVCILMFATPQP